LGHGLLQRAKGGMGFPKVGLGCGKWGGQAKGAKGSGGLGSSCGGALGQKGNGLVNQRWDVPRQNIKIHKFGYQSVL